jgi:HK97 gp10 family phage protein
MDDIKITMFNFTQIERALDELGPKLGKKALSKAIKAGIGVIDTAVGNTTPVKTGALKGAKKVRISMKGDYKSGKATLGFGKQGYKAKWIEFGHKLVKGKKSSGTRKVYGRVKANPFVRTAFDATKQQSIEAFAEVIAEELPNLGKAN